MSANLTISQIQQNQLQASQIIKAHFEQLVTDLEQLKRAPTPKAQANRALVTLAHHKDNLSYSYYRELLYWCKSWQQKSPAILRRLDDSCGCDCPNFVLELLDLMSAEGLNVPRVLDFGCGPFSNLGYLHRQKLANIVGVDALALEYIELYKAFGIEPPIPLVAGSGETLNPDLMGGAFDFTYVQNALDHTAAPSLTWLNLYRTTKIGGFLGHCHGVNEATHEKQDQLHQFNLRPEGDGEMIIDDLNGHVFSLTRGLELELHYQTLMPIRDDYAYFIQIWRKTGEQVAPSLLSDAMENLRRAYVKRSAWAFTTEDDILRRLNLRDSVLPYALHQNKP